MKQKEAKIFLYISILFFSWIFFASYAEAAEPLPVYRFWSPLQKAHFFTISEIEKNEVIAKYTDQQWRYEGMKFKAYKQQEPETSPLYRFWSPLQKAHFFTISEIEKNEVIAKYTDQQWKYEGIAYYAFKEAQPEITTPLYRFWSAKNKAHFYTTSPGEKTCIINNYTLYEWKYEGIAAYVPLTGASISTNEDSCGASLGPSIRVGLEEYSRSYLQDNSFQIKAKSATTGNPIDYSIKDKNGNILATVSGDSVTKVKYDTNRVFIIYDSIPMPINTSDEVSFEASNSNYTNDIVFNFNRPSSTSYRDFRGKIKLRYFDDPVESNYDTVWAINTLPLEQYVWGMGELTAANVAEHNKVMVTIFRTYGKEKIEKITAYDSMGFDLLSTPSSQKYNGYAYEVAKPTIKEAAKATRGKIVTYKGKTALTAYSSWSDGKTRALDLDLYPYLKQVNDPYGDYNGDYWNNPYKSTSTLMNEGNHMMGLIANGSVTLAYELKWDWQRIMKYYYTGIDITSAY